MGFPWFSNVFQQLLYKFVHIFFFRRLYSFLGISVDPHLDILESVLHIDVFLFFIHF
jgi:hypothetical protein